MDIRAVLRSNIVHFYEGSKEVAKAHTDYVFGKGFEPKGIPSSQLKSIIGAYVTKRLVTSRDDLGLGGDTVRFERTNRINKVRCADYGSYFYLYGILFRKVRGYLSGFITCDDPDCDCNEHVLRTTRALYVKGGDVLVSDVPRWDLTFLCYAEEVGGK
jgi:hypothetical protein